MLKQYFHKVWSVAMAVLLLFSTVSFTVEKHFCGTVLIDVAVFSDVQKCGMEVQDIEQETAAKKSCCSDTYDVIEGQDQLMANSFNDLDPNQQLLLYTFTHVYCSLHDINPKQHIPHQTYRPPNLIKDIQVLDQVFLI